MITLENRYVRELIKIANANVGHIEKDDWIDYQVQDFEKVAKEFGYVKLGSGYFSQAWTHPEIKNYAIKLGFKKEDSGAAYAAYCRANQGKAGIPVIHGIERTRACYVVLMDRLISFELVQKALPLYDPIYDTPRVVREYETLHELFEYGLECCYNIDPDNLSELENTAAGIYEHFKGIAYFDMHEGNVMLDKFGRLVITDPVSFGKTCKKEVSTALRAVFGGSKPAFLIKKETTLESAWNSFKENFFKRVVSKPKWTMDIPFNRQSLVKMAVNPNYKPSSSEKELSFAERFGAHGCKKPLFLVQKDIRNGIKHK